MFENIAAAFATASPAIIAAIVTALIGIAVFGALNLSLLVWNLRRLRGFPASEQGRTLASSNAQTQLMTVPLGLTVLAATGYVGRSLSAAQVSPGNYALICPGVALSVLTHFWIAKGLVAAGLIAKFGVAYWTLSATAPRNPAPGRSVRPLWRLKSRTAV